MIKLKKFTRPVGPYLGAVARCILLVSSVISGDLSYAQTSNDSQAIELHTVPKVYQLTRLWPGKIIASIRSVSIVAMDSDAIAYQNADTDDGGQFQAIKTPPNRRLSIQLSDSSLLQVNGGSTVVYPLNFSVASDRDINMEGEILLRLSPRSRQPCRLQVHEVMIVIQAGSTVIVNAYADSSIRRIFVEQGEAVVTVGHSAFTLRAGQRLRLEGDKADVQDDISADHVTQWKDSRGDPKDNKAF